MRTGVRAWALGIGLFSLLGLSACGCDSSSSSTTGTLTAQQPQRLFATTTDGANPRAEAVVELDPATGAELNRFPLPEATPSGYGFDGLAYDGTSLWFITGDGSGMLYELDPDTGAVRDSDAIPAVPGALTTYDALAALGGLIYISDGNGVILVFDPVADTVTNSFDVVALNASVNTISGGLAGIQGPDGLVTTDFASGTVFEINPATGLVRGAYRIPVTASEVPIGAAVILGQTFIAYGFDARYDVYSRAGTFQRTVSLPYEISALAGDDQ